MKTSSNKNIGIKEIAERAKVSTGPVDKVLNNRGGVSKATRERILQAIKDLGYKPNILASRLKSARDYTIAVLIPEATDMIPFWSAHNTGFEEALKEVSPFGINISILTFEQNNEASFKLRVDEVIGESFDGIFMVPVFHDQTIRLLEHCENLNVPVIFFDSNLPGLSNISFIGNHSKDSGYMAANLLDYIISKKGDILIASIEREEDNHVQFSAREEGFLAYFENSGRRIEKFTDNTGSEEVIGKNISAIFMNNPHLEGIFIVNGIDKIAAAITAEQKLNYRIIGYDLVDKNIQMLKDGAIDFLISQQPQKQAYQGIKLFYDLLILKKTIAPSYFLPLDIVMRANIDYYRFL
ncbi:LacI family DNA-binding transcriptional regulator [Mucilaginibacter sp. PPCGB 2223]|uniref:LacI family DNA-binding transcriptional regulator n=1 Tax=Mucilaginibacter sp. PPCGB 2223 TaxID=1886027 RepID=UPI001111AE11|nr:LacI family DNA-binding transcriptional regulator [Mucilaginibacter sp. PPCGB 2223]